MRSWSPTMEEKIKFKLSPYGCRSALQSTVLLHSSHIRLNFKRSPFQKNHHKHGLTVGLIHLVNLMLSVQFNLIFSLGIHLGVIFPAKSNNNNTVLQNTPTPKQFTNEMTFTISCSYWVWCFASTFSYVCEVDTALKLFNPVDKHDDTKLMFKR